MKPARGAVFVCALLLALVALTAPAQANTVVLAAGEEFYEAQATAPGRSPDVYFTDRRYLAPYSQPAFWRLLKRHHATLAVHLRYKRDFGPVPAGHRRHDDVWPILKGARRHGVPIQAWIVVPYADGYWAHDGDVAQVRQAVDDYFAWAKRRHVHATGIQLDLETSIQDLHTLGNLRSDPVSVGQMLRRNVDPAAQCAAANGYADLVKSIRARGTEVVASVVPFVLDDLADGNVALQDGLNTPLFSPGEFDTAGFMTMRTVLKDLIGVDPGPSVLASYEQSIERYYPRDGQLVLGVAGVPPYDNLKTLTDDVRVAATVNRQPVGMYSLEGIWRAFGQDGLRRVLDAAEHPLPAAPAIDANAQSVRAAVSAMDGLVGAGTPLTGPSNTQAPQLPNRWPAPCGS